jgi:hypothetical protein
MSGSGSLVGSGSGDEAPGDRLATTSITYFALAIIGFISFCWIRGCMPWFYYPRRIGEENQQKLIEKRRRRRIREQEDENENVVEGNGSGNGGHGGGDEDVPPLSVSSCGSWLKYLWKADGVEEEEEGGFVASVYLSLMRHHFFFIVGSQSPLFFLLPSPSFLLHLSHPLLFYFSFFHLLVSSHGLVIPCRVSS